MRRFATILAAAALATALFATAAQAAEFGLKDLDVTFTNEDGSPALLAGSHPFAVTFDVAVNTEEEGGEVVPVDAVKDITIEQPAGFAGVPAAVATCDAAVFLASASGGPPCPNETVLGKTSVLINRIDEQLFTEPVYNLDPPPGALLKLGFVPNGIPVTLVVDLSPTFPFNPRVRVANIAQVTGFFSSSTTVWGNPSSSAHDEERGTCLKSAAADECPVSTLDEQPFITLPRSCTGPLETRFEADSWQNPGAWVKPPAVLSHDDSEPPQPRGLSGCEDLRFDPGVEVQPTTDRADSATGLDFSLAIEDEGIDNPGGRAQSDIKKVVVTFPPGITANPSLAEGLGACTPADFSRESLGSAPGAGCPQSSKIGTVEVETPLLAGRILKGQLFVASPYDNPYNKLLALYMVIRDAEKGVFVALPGAIDPDPQTGQLVSTFGAAPYEIPQFPISNLRLHLREGGRGPLVTPPACATYTTRVAMTPWANPSEVVTLEPTMTIGHGVGGAPCPLGLPFAPGFQGGALNNSAGAHSPFVLRLTRRDGEQDLTRFSVSLPPGVTATLAGVGQCPEAAIAAARLKSGASELAAPSCPASARVGGVLAGAGVGSELTYVGGSLYLAGPWEGAPISTVAIVPAVAGPFDVGTVVVRQALRIDPRSAQVEVDGARSEPIPHILAGIPLRVRDIRAYIDRPGFTLNPTSCEPSQVAADIWGGGANPLTPADDVAVAAADYFQAASCAALDFAPKLFLRLKGGTRRNSYPALRAVLRPRAGQSNISGAVVRLPRSAFLEQAHINTICTRPRFAADQCPKGSIYGYAKAFTPILDTPVQGPVYLRSSDNTLPDLVADLRGPSWLPIKTEIVGRIDSVNGGIRSSFEGVPDIPVSKFVLNMKGGKKGLIVNSRNLCKHRSFASALFIGQNGKRFKAKRPLNNDCAKKAKKPAKRHQRAR